MPLQGSISTYKSFCIIIGIYSYELNETVHAYRLKQKPHDEHILSVCHKFSTCGENSLSVFMYAIYDSAAIKYRQFWGTPDQVNHHPKLSLIFEQKYMISFERVLDLLNFHFFMKVHSATSGRTLFQFWKKVFPLYYFFEQ